MIFIELVSLLAVSQYLAFGMLVARARGQYKVAAPAMTGPEGFERMVRVQANTLELLVAFLPALWLAAQHASPALMAGLGAIYLLGRVIYLRAYLSKPSSRALGFSLSFFPICVLIGVGLFGVARQLLG
ncbi:MAPEG family protein [Ideonella sp.]|uniref:MAPEG family protein n=1 Tax=Ideonella sp. TaxID=1929293 RepID=UPI003BB5B884